MLRCQISFYLSCLDAMLLAICYLMLCYLPVIMFKAFCFPKQRPKFLVSYAFTFLHCGRARNTNASSLWASRTAVSCKHMATPGSGGGLLFQSRINTPGSAACDADMHKAHGTLEEIKKYYWAYDHCEKMPCWENLKIAVIRKQKAHYAAAQQ